MISNIVKVASLVINDKEIWASDEEMGLIKVDLDKYSIELYKYTDNPMLKTPYSSIIAWNQKLFLIPYSGNNFTYFDLNIKEFKTIDVNFENNVIYNNTHEKFRAYAKYRNNLYVFPWRFSVIVKIDMDTCKASVIDSWMKEFTSYISNPKLTLFRIDSIVINETVYLVTLQASVIFKFDMKTMEYEFLDIQGNFKGFRTICKYEDGFYMSDYKNDLYKYFESTGVIEKICDSNEWGDNFFNRSFRVEDKIWFVPRYGCKLCYWDLINEQSGQIIIENTDNEISYTKLLNENMLFLQTKFGSKYIYSFVQNKIEKIDFDETGIVNEYREYLIRNRIWQGKNVVEGSAFIPDLVTLFDLLDCTKKEAYNGSKTNYGNEIYKNIGEQNES